MDQIVLSSVCYRFDKQYQSQTLKSRHSQKEVAQLENICFRVEIHTFRMQRKTSLSFLPEYESYPICGVLGQEGHESGSLFRPLSLDPGETGS